ncbi:MAG: hypothetical protein MJ137_00890 [Clostridia bacterium]|nr:hypothetical protein [Clostridia bacterium]
MKNSVKIISLLLILVMALAAVSCGEKTVEYTLGMGVVTNDHDMAAGKAQNNSLVATVLLADGKIVSCRVDAAQNVATIAEDGSFTVTKLEKTKRELGNDYNMATYGKDTDNNGDGVVKEWFEQAEAFEKWCEGKTPAEVEALKTKAATQGAVGYQIADDDALLSAGCTIQVADFRDAVVKACKDDQAVKFTLSAKAEVKLGVAVNSSLDSSSAAATAEKDGAVNMYSDFAAAAVSDGKVVATVNDAVQPKITFKNNTDAPTFSFKATKRELKSEYNMAAYGSDNNGDGIVKEWFEQSAAFSAFVTGKTAAEIAAMKTQTVNDHQISVEEDLLKAGCTMQITGLSAVVAKAANNAR